MNRALAGRDLLPFNFFLSFFIRREKIMEQGVEFPPPEEYLLKAAYEGDLGMVKR